MYNIQYAQVLVLAMPPIHVLYLMQAYNIRVPLLHPTSGVCATAEADRGALINVCLKTLAHLEQDGDLLERLVETLLPAPLRAMDAWSCETNSGSQA